MCVCRRLYPARRLRHPHGPADPTTSTVRPNRRTSSNRPPTCAVPKLFEQCATLGDEVELLHDVHERVPPALALQLAKDLEPYRLFFLEDPLPPEEIGHFRDLRQHTQFRSPWGAVLEPAEYLPLIQERLIDFIRIHLSQIGGLDHGRAKSPRCASSSGCAPPGMDRATRRRSDTPPTWRWTWPAPTSGSRNSCPPAATHDVFPGSLVPRDGCLWANESPGWGIDVDEQLAAKFPFPDHPYNGAWPAIAAPMAAW